MNNCFTRTALTLVSVLAVLALQSWHKSQIWISYALLPCFGHIFSYRFVNRFDASDSLPYNRLYSFCSIYYHYSEYSKHSIHWIYWNALPIHSSTFYVRQCRGSAHTNTVLLLLMAIKSIVSSHSGLYLPFFVLISVLIKRNIADFLWEAVSSNFVIRLLCEPLIVTNK